MTKTYKTMNSDEKQIITLQFRKVWHDDKKMVKHCVGSTSNFFTSDDGIIVTFEKPHIQTRFCFGEHGYDYDEVQGACRSASKSVDHFMAENLRQLESYASAWGASDRYPMHRRAFIKRGAYIRQDADCALGRITLTNATGRDAYGKDLSLDGWRELTPAEVKRLRDAQDRRDYLFRKRLDSYLKRYGLSKCDYWTYWADR